MRHSFPWLDKLTFKEVEMLIKWLLFEEFSVMKFNSNILYIRLDWFTLANTTPTLAVPLVLDVTEQKLGFWSQVFFKLAFWWKVSFSSYLILYKVKFLSWIFLPKIKFSLPFMTTQNCSSGSHARSQEKYQLFPFHMHSNIRLFFFSTAKWHSDLDTFLELDVRT